VRRLTILLGAAILAVTPDLAPTAPAVAVAVAGAPSAAAPPYHVVRPGETIRSIARAYRIRRRDLRAWNSIRSPNQPRPDGVLHLGRPATGRLTGWRSWAERVTPGAVNWDPRKRCPVPPFALRKVWVTYIDFYGVPHRGSIIVHWRIVLRTRRAFRALYRMRFRIQGMSPMTRNAPYISDMSRVTAGYNCRRVGGTHTWSQHAYGMAIDVNPLQNPVVRGGRILSPVGGAEFRRRGPYRRGMMHAGGAVRAFTRQGFHWGGWWIDLQDHMHFSLNGD
jgi:hypothetical protein